MSQSQLKAHWTSGARLEVEFDSSGAKNLRGTSSEEEKKRKMTKKARWSSLSSEAPSADTRVADAEGAGRAAPDGESESESEEEFAFSRNYFLAKELGGKSRRKSARKVSDINPVDEQVLRAASSGLVAKHEKEIRDLLNSYKDLYPKWLFELRCGFGILTYGFGSKKTLLEDFASSTLTNYSVVVINGYLQQINLKQVVLTLAELLWNQLKAKQKSSKRNGSQIQHPSGSQSMEDLILILHDRTLKDFDIFICLIIHNIDGPGLRDYESQQCLAQIACCSGVRIIASVDHINAPLLWDKKMVHSQFNWCWYHVPTFIPYKVEGVFFPLILATGSTVQNAKTALIVLQSLTPNAQSVFKALAEYQLAHPKEEGMPMNALYSVCRERFLVSSQVTLNSHLVEFKDHDLIKIRRNCEGQDCYYVPLSAEALEKLLQELN